MTTNGGQLGRNGHVVCVTGTTLIAKKSQEEDIERILKEAKEYYRKKGLISDAEWVAYKKDLESPNYPYAYKV